MARDTGVLPHLGPVHVKHLASARAKLIPRGGRVLADGRISGLHGVHMPHALESRGRIENGFGCGWGLHNASGSPVHADELRAVPSEDRIHPDSDDRFRTRFVPAFDFMGSGHPVWLGKTDIAAINRRRGELRGAWAVT